MENKWFSTLSAVSDLLRDSGIRHVFIKNLVNPFEWGDIDVLIPNPLAVVRAGGILEGQGFIRGSAGRISPPLKSVFERDGVIVEIYPEASWKRGMVADAERIVSDRIMNENLEVYTPRAEDDFYLIATHAFSHMRVTEVEAENAARLIQNGFDWARVRDTAVLFGTHVSVYFFMKTLNRLEVPKIFSNPVDKLIDGWFGRGKNTAFPVGVPRIFGRVLAPLHHTPAMLRNGIGIKGVLYDFISNLC